MAEQNLEKFVFVRRQMNFGPADDHAPGSKINADISKIHSLCSVVLVQYGRTAEAGTNTRGYFTWIERFADVVVGRSEERRVGKGVRWREVTWCVDKMRGV